ncbi:NUDIX hydrolase [Candidatus Woesearchaeota archaeon]|nr:NUDIX hydrolase [Candidatus Woesearchaeota archaeon]
MEIKKKSLIVFFDDKKRILLQDRRNHSKFGENWGFFGGSLEREENFKDALVREVKEELDFDLDLSEVNFVDYMDFEIEGIRAINAMFVCPLGDKLKNFVVLEGSGAELFSIEDAKKLNTVGANKFIHKHVDIILDKIKNFIESKI